MLQSFRCSWFGGSEKLPVLAANEAARFSHGRPKAFGDSLFKLFAFSDAGRHESGRRIVKNVRPVPNGKSHARRFKAPFGRDYVALLIVIPKPQPAAFERWRRLQKQSDGIFGRIDDRAVIVVKAVPRLTIDLIAIRYRRRRLRKK
jgi:hypothetical protein